jgi:iron complex transport system substrate-binding protein
VKTGRVYALSHALLERPGPRLIDGLEQLARLVHPELFR